nr:MAG TPA: HepA-related protein (HARP) [Caudoviricetes sp.]
MENLKIFANAVGRISVAVPFSRGFIAAARSISGRWDAPEKVWTFDSRDRERLTEILYKFFGYVEHPSGELATVRAILDEDTYEEEQGQVKFLGRVIASRWSRDEAVRLADGVVKVSGEFSRSGGSLAHPRVCPGGCQPVVLEIRDIPHESLGAERDLKWVLVSTYPAAIKAKSDPEWHTIRLGSSLLTSYL